MFEDRRKTGRSTGGKREGEYTCKDKGSRQGRKQLQFSTHGKKERNKLKTESTCEKHVHEHGIYVYNTKFLHDIFFASKKLNWHISTVFCFYITPTPLISPSWPAYCRLRWK